MGHDGFDLTRDGRRLGYVVNEDGIDTLHVLDTQSNAEIALPPLPYGNVRGLKWHRNGRDLGFTIESARMPLAAIRGLLH